MACCPKQTCADVLASQALQALLAAATASGADASVGAPGVAAAAALLRGMRPSAKVLASLEVQLGASAGGPGGAVLHSRLPAAARQVLAAFVVNHVASDLAAGAEEDAQVQGAHAGAGDAVAGAQHKRKRAQSGGAKLQQRLAELLRSGGSGDGRRAGRAGRKVGAASTHAAASSAAPTVGPAPTSSVCAPGGREGVSGASTLAAGDLTE